MRIAYYRVSTGDQSIEAQRHALGGSFDKEFSDEGVSGGILAADRPGFAKLLEQVRRGDTVCVYAVDRLGRDALDVQSTVRRLMDAGVLVDVRGLSPLTGEAGQLILAVLAQIADMERKRITERTAMGLATARASLHATGKTHRGKDSLGRPKAHDGAAVVAWRKANGGSIEQTARQFGISVSTVKRYEQAARTVVDPLAALAHADPEVQTRSLETPLEQRMRLSKERDAERDAVRAAEVLALDGKDPLAL